MFTAEESRPFQHLSARKAHDLDHMALLQLERNYNLPCFLPTTFTANAAFPGQLREVDTVQQGAGVENLKLQSSHWGVSHPAGYHYPRDTQYALPHRFGGTTKPIDISCAPQKRFLIFDQSGNNTRLFVSPLFPPKNQVLAFESPVTRTGFNEHVTAQVGQQLLVNPKVEEKWDENDLVDEDGEMLEDSEEINALLYSDSEFDDDTDDENDEVTSTLQTPSTMRDDYNIEKTIGEHKEEVASSDDSPKRQRLLGGSFKKSSLVSFESPVKQGASSCNYEEDDDLESCCGGVRSYRNDTDLSKREKKVKIRDALKIIESLLPGSKNMDTFSIIDNAILYLRSMKTDALALGLGHAESIPLS